MNVHRVVRVAAVVSVLGAALVMNPAAGVAGTDPCAGGTLPPGGYTSLHINTACAISGNVGVNGGLTVDTGGAVTVSGGGLRINGGLTLAPGGSLRVTAGSLRENGSVDVGAGASLTAQSPAIVRENGRITVHGNGDFELVCLAPAKCAPKTAYSTNGGIVADASASIVLRGVRVNGGVSVGQNGVSIGGAGAPSCAATSMASNRINGKVTVTGVPGCALAMISNRINGGLAFTNNSSADPTGNEISGNNINGGLDCSGNTPAAHGSQNVVNGPKTGECASL